MSDCPDLDICICEFCKKRYDIECYDRCPWCVSQKIKEKRENLLNLVKKYSQTVRDSASVLKQLIHETTEFYPKYYFNVAPHSQSMSNLSFDKSEAKYSDNSQNLDHKNLMLLLKEKFKVDISDEDVEILDTFIYH